MEARSKHLSSLCLGKNLLAACLPIFRKNRKKGGKEKEKKIATTRLKEQAPPSTRAACGYCNILLCIATGALVEQPQTMSDIAFTDLFNIALHCGAGVSTGIQIKCTQAERIWLWANPISLFTFRLVILM